MEADALGVGVAVTVGVSLAVSLGDSVTVGVGSDVGPVARFGSSSRVIEHPEKAPLMRSPSVAAATVAARFLVVGMASA